MTILFLGDILGDPGKSTVSSKLPSLIKDHNINFTIANAECSNKNTASVSPDDVSMLLDAGINCITTGEKVWYKKEMVDFLNTNPSSVLRPLNYPPGVPGLGSAVYPQGIAVLNLMGRAFMINIDCPFRTGMQEIEKLSSQSKIIIIDFHAQTTAEKQAFSYWVDGKVSAVIGTHTPVQTTDEKILSGGTAFISSVGFTGVKDSIAGIQKDLYIRHFLTGIPVDFIPAQGDTQLNAIILDIAADGRATSIKRLTV